MMTMQKRIANLENLYAGGGGRSWIDASLLTDDELQALMDAKATGGAVLTQAYGLIEIEKPNNDEV